MACPNLPQNFDFLDPDVNLKALPVEELAELRKSEPIHWVDVPGGTGGFGDKGYWLVTKHADVKEVSKRSDVFGSSPDGAIPVWPQEMTRDAIDLQRNVLLNMDAPSTPGCARSSRAVSPRVRSAASKRSSTSGRRTSPRPPWPTARATSSSRSPPNCRCRPSPNCSACRRTIATRSSAGPTR